MTIEGILLIDMKTVNRPIDPFIFEITGASFLFGFYFQISTAMVLLESEIKVS